MTDNRLADYQQTTIAGILRSAARYLADNGWTQNSFYDYNHTATPTPPACVLGAICVAAYGRLSDPYGPELDESDVRNFVDAQRALSDHIGGSIPGWNDATWDDITSKPRTVAEVIAALHTAADSYERTHGGDT